MDVGGAVRALAALAHEHRLTLFRMLVEAGPEGLSAGAMAEALGVPASSLSFHTKALAAAGLVSQRRSSRQLFYAADYAAMAHLILFLTENCCGRASVPTCAPATCSSADQQDPR